jgi:transposase
VIEVSRKGKRYSPKFQFQVVLELLKGDREAAEIARAYNIHPTTVSRWKQEFLEKGAEVFGKDTTVAQYEKKIKELEQLLGRKEVEIALLRNFMEGGS